VPFGFPRQRPALDPAWRPAGSGLASGLLTRGGASRKAIEGAEAALGVSLPKSLADFFEQADAAEGWVAGDYLAMWPMEELANLNRLARVAEFGPGLVAIATNGGMEGFFFDTAKGGFLSSPMIGLGYIESTAIGGTFDELLAWLASENPTSGEALVADPTRFGFVVHEVTPVLFGGSPTDPENKTLVPLAKFAELVGWWNAQVGNANSPDLGRRRS